MPEKTKVEAKVNLPDKNTEKRYTKDAILKSERYRNRRDIIYAALDPKKSYTTAEVDAIISKYDKKISKKGAKV